MTEFSILDRFRHRMVNTLRFPPRFVGYPCLHQISTADYCGAFGKPLTKLMSDSVIDSQLPCNMGDRSELESCKGKYAFSFAEVPGLHQSGPVVAELCDCRLLRVRDKWGDDYYAVITNDDRELLVDGCGFSTGHSRILRRQSNVREIDTACWVSTHATRNYFLWLINHLPRIHFAQEYCANTPILLPAADLLDKTRVDSLAMLGVQGALSLNKSDEVVKLNRLLVFRYDPFNSNVLDAIRQRLTSNICESPRDKRVYICREQCAYRHAVNESAFWKRIKQHGFERVFLENLSLREQIELMSRAEAVIGLHGAGFANTLFCAPGTHVAEIRDSGSPNPHFFAMASVLGHNYWHFVGAPSEGKPLYRDLTVNLDALQPFLDNVSSGSKN